MRARWIPLFFLFTSLSALAQEPPRADLEKMYREVSEKSIPKTVCLTANLPQGEVAIGSGAVVSADGYILTCAHVLEAAENLGDNTLGALFPNGKTLEARTLGRDSKKDFVLLKVDAENIPFLNGEILPKSNRESGSLLLAIRSGSWEFKAGETGFPHSRTAIFSP